MRLVRFLAATSLLTALPALAQQDPAPEGEVDDQGRRIIYEKNTKMDFDLKTIEVEKKWKPMGILTDSRTGQKYEPIIQERAHFKKELAKSVGFSVTEK